MTRFLDRKKDVSYLVEMLKHPVSKYGLLGSLAAGAVISIPLGLGPAVIPLLGYFASTSIAALFIPGSRRFRDIVDRKARRDAREQTREHLANELRKRAGSEHGAWAAYARIVERFEAIRRAAAVNEGLVSEAELERLDDATVDFLALWLGRIAIHERSMAINERVIRERIARLDDELARSENEEDNRRLGKAKADLARLLERRAEMRSRDAAAEAQMLSMADTFDELYQRMMSGSTSRETMAVELRQAVERFDVAEELDAVLYDEVESMLRGGTR